jgi:hypothetical protein
LKPGTKKESVQFLTIKNQNMNRKKFKVVIPESKVDDFIAYCSPLGVQIVSTYLKEGMLFEPDMVTAHCIVDEDKIGEISNGAWKQYLKS